MLTLNDVKAKVSEHSAHGKEKNESLLDSKAEKQIHKEGFQNTSPTRSLIHQDEIKRNKSDYFTPEMMQKQDIQDKLNLLETACKLLLSLNKLQGNELIKDRGSDKTVICKKYHREASLKRTQVRFLLLVLGGGGDKRTERQTDKLTDRQTDGQTDGLMVCFPSCPDTAFETLVIRFARNILMLCESQQLTSFLRRPFKHPPETLDVEIMFFVHKHTIILYSYQVSQVWRKLLQVSDEDITLVTQMTEDRIPLLDLVGRHWPGPISAAICCTKSALFKLREIFQGYPRLLARKNLDIHLVNKVGVCK